MRSNSVKNVTAFVTLVKNATFDKCVVLAEAVIKETVTPFELGKRKLQLFFT